MIVCLRLLRLGSFWFVKERMLLLWVLGFCFVAECTSMIMEDQFGIAYFASPQLCAAAAEKYVIWSNKVVAKIRLSNAYVLCYKGISSC